MQFTFPNRGVPAPPVAPGPSTLAHRIRPPLCAIACLVAQTAAAQNLLEEVVVTSSRVPTTLRETGTSVSVLAKADIEARGFLTLPDLLRTQPAVAASNNGGVGKATTLRIRGEEGYRTMVLLDGIDIADTSSPQVSPRLEHLLSMGIERVEILRGPQGLHYGADAGGVINISTTGPDDGIGGRLSAEAGRFGTQQLAGSVGGDLGAVDFMLNGARFETDGFNARATDTDLADDDGYANTTLHARAGWDVNDALRLEGVVRSVSGDNAFDGCFTASFQPSNDCSDEFRQDSWRLAAELDTGSFLHQLSYSDNRMDREFFAAGSSFFGTDGGLERISYVGRWQGADRLSLVYGADHETESINDGSFDRERDQRGVFAEYQGRLTDALTLTAGARWDDNDDFGDFTSYRVSAAHVTALGTGDLKLKASYGTGFRAPSLYEISYNSGPFAAPPAADTRLVEESSAGYDLGVTWASDSGVFVEAVWFEQRVDDLITFDLLGFSGYLQDAGESTSRGVELAGRYPLTRGLTLQGNYTWNETALPGGEQRPFRPQQLLNLGLSWLRDDGRLRAGINLRASADAVDTTGSAIDDYVLVDANASYRLLAGLLVYARVENGLDERYREIPTFNTAGQAAFAGMRYEF